MNSSASTWNSSGGKGFPAGLFFCGLLFFAAAAPFFLTNDPILQGNDNLDGANLVLLHILKLYGAVFSFDAQIPMLHGLSRLFFPAELKVWGFLFAFCDDFLLAYRINLLLKIAVGYCSMAIFLKTFAAAENDGPWLRRMVAACFAVLPCQPENALSFASLPLVFCLFRAVYLNTGPAKTPDRRPLSPALLAALFAGIACYPLLSDFSRYGLYILFVLGLFFLYDAIRQKRPHLPFAAGIALLALGYVLTEYRLFYVFLWLRPETIREEFRHGSYSYFNFHYTLTETLELLLDGQYHFASTAHKYILLPAVLLFMLLGGRGRSPGRSRAKLFFAAFVAIIAARWLYLYVVVELLDAHVRIFRIIQLDRVYIFLPIILYSLFYMAMASLAGRAGKPVAVLCVAAQAACIIMTPAIYNDALRNIRRDTYAAEDYGYREYFSQALFANIKKQIHYAGEWSVAVGFPPSVLSFNGIHTLDGYHSYYPLAYKHAFRTVIAPELAADPDLREYFDYWGCRAYIVGNEAGAKEKRSASDSVTLRINPEAFARLGGRYIFSRTAIANSGELGLALAGEFSDPASPYVIHLYEARSGAPAGQQPEKGNDLTGRAGADQGKLILKLSKSSIASGGQRGSGTQALCDPLWKPHFVSHARRTHAPSGCRLRRFSVARLCGTRLQPG